MVAVGLAFEARLARTTHGAAICCAPGIRMTEALGAHIRPGCAGILSFGIAGGLDPELAPGTGVVASSVVGRGRTIPTDDEWTQTLLASHPRAVHAPLLGVDAPVTAPADKIDLFRRTGAAALDMESHIAGSIAARHGLPFAVFRVIADAAHRTVPRAALRGMRADGSLDAMAVVRAMARAPREIGAMLALVCHTFAARRTLARARYGFGPSLGLPDFL
ncbi:MAG TPA: adenosylhopane nucleosidase [Pseudolabrys sp.]|nr:adenosylhopane nucleosidase [Pseudolabrys sp.]